MTEKVVGYILLVGGILLILFSGYSVYSVFTKRAQPTQLFNFEGISLNVSQPIPGVKEVPKTELISGNILNDSSNIFAHLFLMGFVAATGYKLASIGAMLVRPIKVKLKEAPPPKETPEKN
jgi:hypothetical protein